MDGKLHGQETREAREVPKLRLHTLISWFEQRICGRPGLLYLRHGLCKDRTPYSVFLIHDACLLTTHYSLLVFSSCSLIKLDTPLIFCCSFRSRYYIVDHQHVLNFSNLSTFLFNFHPFTCR